MNGNDRATALLEASPDATAVLDRSGTIVAVNQTWRTFGAANGADPATTGVGASYLDTCLRSAAAGCEDAAVAACALREVLDGGETHREIEYPCPTPTENMWFVLRVAPLYVPPEGAVMSHVDITRHKTTELDLIHRATHDPLTGLANRHLFDSRLGAALGTPARPAAHSGVGVLYIDLDGMKRVNDLHGHLTGDAVLHAVADRLRGQVRAQDTVARLGGDEFAVITPDVTIAELAVIQLRTMKLLARPHYVCGHDLHVPASIGVRLASSGEFPDDVLQQADAAMYATKRRLSPRGPT